MSEGQPPAGFNHPPPPYRGTFWPGYAVNDIDGGPPVLVCGDTLYSQPEPVTDQVSFQALYILCLLVLSVNITLANQAMSSWNLIGQFRKC